MSDGGSLSRHKSLFKDRVFTADDWELQKNWRRHIPNGTFFWVIVGLWRWIAYFTFISFALCCYHQWLVPLGAPDWPQPANPNTWQIFNLTAFALSLLMVFKTNSSYARWWEARTVWGTVIIAVRNLVRRALADMGEEHQEARAMFVRWSAALPYLLKDHLTQRTSCELKELLHLQELDLVSSWSHKPNSAASVLTRILRQVDLPEYVMVAVDDQILSYVGLVAACERIKTTPIPHAYTSHHDGHLLLLLGTENVGIQIEEPFSILPMDVYCKALASNVLEMYDKCQVTNALVAAFLTPAVKQGKMDLIAL